MSSRGRRFERPAAESPGAADPRTALEAEVVLLREENARLKAARRHPLDVSEELDRSNLADETSQMLVEGLVIRESLIEICRDIERSMVNFKARLDALASAADQLVPLRGKPEEQEGSGDVDN
jgi:hypothetical protein